MKLISFNSSEIAHEERDGRPQLKVSIDIDEIAAVEPMEGGAGLAYSNIYLKSGVKIEVKEKARDVVMSMENAMR